MTMRRLILLGGVLLIVALAATGYRYFSGDDNWVCRDGAWVANGQPNSPPPTVACGVVVNGPVEDTKIAEGLVITNPDEGESVMSPLTVSGEARGAWYFEASFPVRLEDASGRILATVPAQAQGEWMTEDFVPYVAELAFEVATKTPGRLVLSKDNPSGLPEYDEERSVAVVLMPPPVVQVFFANERLDPAFTCEKVWPVERTLRADADLKIGALEALLAGPLDGELADKYSTVINSGVTVNKLEVGTDGVARVDLSPRLNEAVAGSCRVGLIRAQITATLRQFPDVREVVISVNGAVDEILQP